MPPWLILALEVAANVAAILLGIWLLWRFMQARPSIHRRSGTDQDVTQRPPLRSLLPLVLATCALTVFPEVAAAHVKWFSDFSYAETPRTVADVLTPTFIGLVLLSVVAVSALVPLDRWLERQTPYQAVNRWLGDRADSGHGRLHPQRAIQETPGREAGALVRRPADDQQRHQLLLGLHARPGPLLTGAALQSLG